MHAKYVVFISYGSKVIVKVRVDNRQRDRQTNKQTDRQTGQKQNAPDQSIRGHKKWKGGFNSVIANVCIQKYLSF